ncbi:MAG: SusD/RagB family nutrient-binding outer membrane lipoprotein [Tannerellaceae bacterium]|jgi:hypothetical protein|nr:SusD/RagB family nutrient-binding outer membrane lipoprotein [Tannerellaceae bacterium]
MKKIISILLLAACVLFTFSSCEEASYDEKYADPGKAASATLDKLMPGTLLYANDWVCSTYGRYFGYDPLCLGLQTNTLGVSLRSSSYYLGNLNYIDYGQPYNEYPKMVTNFRKMQQIYEELPENEQAANEGYLIAAETHLYGVMIFLLSEYGPIPFEGIGQVALQGDISYASPHFDDDQALWTNILNRLGEIAAKFATIPKPASFAGQDFINGGDLVAWQRYANSLRLRAALRISTNGPLASEGQRIIKEILGNPSAYPIVESNDQNIDISRQTSGPLNIEGGSGFDWPRERFAAGEIIKRMQQAGNGGVWVPGQDDPRLPLMYCLATKNGETPVEKAEEEAIGDPLSAGMAIASVYRGTYYGESYDSFQEHYTEVNDRGGYLSLVRRFGFFYGNQNWDHLAISAAEMHFIKAEAIQRGWVNGDAKAAFKEGIRQSVKLLFKYHNTRSRTEADNSDSNPRDGIQQRTNINPDESVYNDTWISAFGDARWETRIDGSTYERGGKLEAILEQKWLAYGYLNCGEQWSDLRRTGYPWMFYNQDNSSTALAPHPLNRLRYVDSERNYNENYQAEAAPHDNYSEVLFWAKNDWHDGPTW